MCKRLAIALLAAPLATLAASVTVKSPSEFRPAVDSVVTDVDLSGLASTGYADDATNGVFTFLRAWMATNVTSGAAGIATETDPTVGLTNGTVYIHGSSITPLTSYAETDPSVPSWAKSQTPPESAPTNTVLLVGSSLMTKDGQSIDFLQNKQTGISLTGDSLWPSITLKTIYGNNPNTSLSVYNLIITDDDNVHTIYGTSGITYGSYTYNFPNWGGTIALTNQLSDYVPKTRKVNNIPLSGDITLTAASVGAATSSDVSTAIASAGHLTQSAADAAYYPKSFGEAWSAYWNGEDVRVTVTNYDSSVSLPSLSIEQNTNDTDQASSAFRTVWREMARWEAFLGTNWNWRTSWSGFASWSSSLQDELSDKADRAWGFYNSHTGLYSPSGYTVVSSSNIMIAAGMSYQKTVTSSADIWVLTANEPYEPTGVSTNGGFQIRDGDGNVQFEIVKGDKVTVAAQANAVAVTNGTLYVVYNIIATEHPTCEICLSLENPAWKAESASECPATVAWSGSSGRYVAAITPKVATSKCFCKAYYTREGSTYINNRCAVGLSQLVLGGVTYDLGTASIDGHTVLTLTPAN